MLAHFEHFNFSSLLVNFDLLHVFLVHGFYRHLAAVLLVGSQLD